jgi:Domain of unknown function (DUF4168)
MQTSFPYAVPCFPAILTLNLGMMQAHLRRACIIFSTTLTSRSQSLRFIALLLGLWLLVIPASWAQENPVSDSALPDSQEQTLSRPSLNVNDIPSEKVSQFIQAYLQVVALIDQREGALQGAETESESLRIQQEIEAEAFNIIETSGLTWQEYVQLLGLANTDPEFGERIAIQLQEAGS